jgi:hypothetical protein
VRCEGSDVRAIALDLPEVQEIETWGNATFRVRNKIFTILAADGLTASIKASLEEQRALVGEDPETFGIASYVGRFGWVTVTLARVDPAVLKELIGEGWASTAPKRLVRAWESDL